MSERSVIEIDKSEFTVKLYEDILKIDLKGTIKNEVEQALENSPILKVTFGSLLGIFVPLHVRLADIDSVKMDDSGNVRIVLPRHRDVVIPLEIKEAKKLIDKICQLIPRAKDKELARVLKEQKLRKVVEAERELEKEEIVSSTGSGTFPLPKPLGMQEKQKEAKEEVVKKEEEKLD
jgi:hypothetical protein